MKLLKNYKTNLVFFGVVDREWEAGIRTPKKLQIDLKIDLSVF